MGYPMLQLVFTGYLNLLELFLAYKIIYYTTINHSNKLGTKLDDWYNHQLRLKSHGKCKKCK